MAINIGKPYTDLIADVNTKLSKTTYEESKELACGSNGKVCLGKFGAYDTNITIELNSTTSTTYHATIVIHSQNVAVNSTAGSVGCYVYGDADNHITPLLSVFRPYGSASRQIEVYADLAGWSKNLVHIQGVAISTGGMTDVLTSVSSIPTAIDGKIKVTPINVLKNMFASKDVATTSTAGLLSAADKKKLDGIAEGANNFSYTLPAAGSSLGGVKTGGDVTISDGVITVNDDSHNHTIANVDGLQAALNGKQPSGSYVTTTNTGVQSIAGGLVVGGSSATATGKGRIMVTGNTNPLIGLQAIDSSGNQLTPYYFQVANNVMYLGPTSSKALAFDSSGNTSIPASLTVTGTITEGGTALSSKYASKSVATTSASGLMSAADKTKLDGVPTFRLDSTTLYITT